MAGNTDDQRTPLIVGLTGQSIFKDDRDRERYLDFFKESQSDLAPGCMPGVAWCRGNALRQLEEGKTAQRSIRFADRDPLLSIHSLLITFV